jgi:hypothetical protein
VAAITASNALAEARLLRERLRDGEKLRPGIDTDRAPARHDPSCQVARDNAAAAADVQDALAGAHAQEIEIGVTRGDLVGRLTARLEILENEIARGARVEPLRIAPE